MNPNQIQAIEDEEEGVDEIGEDIDYDAVYGGIDIEQSSEPRSQELQNSYKRIFPDAFKQGSKELLIGLGGTYGDLLQLAGAKPKQNPSSEIKNLNDFETLEKINKPGYKPSASDFLSLSDEDDLLPSGGLSSSEDLRSLNKMVGGPEEAETSVGKGVGRAGRIAGSGLAFGATNPIPALVGGAAGQTAEELGGGELAQTAAEIAGILLSPQSSVTKGLSSPKKQVQEKIDSLRNLGYTDEDITLAINSASKGKKLRLKASKGESSKEAFQNAKERSNDLVNDIISSEISGFEQGAQHVKQAASDVYGDVVSKYGSMKIPEKALDPFVNSMDQVFNQAKRVIGNNAEGKKFISELTQDVSDIISNPNAEDMIYFYQRLNDMGKWVKGDKKNQLIRMAKNSIKDTFKNSGSKGSQLAKDFEGANNGIQKAYKAIDVMEILEKTSTQDGRDFNKLYKVFDKKENVDLFNDVLGQTQTKNLQQIAKTGRDINNFDKSWKEISSLSGVGGNVSSLLYYLYHGGSIKGLIGAGIIKGGQLGAQRLAEKALTDPKLQSLIIRGLHSVKTKSAKTFGNIASEVQKNLKDSGIEINQSGEEDIE